MAYGVSFRSRRVKCRNHWTREWGLNGNFYVGFDDMEWLIGEQGEILVPVPV
jgi:hypothetical protein